jgi:DNA repair protein SbcC/Rad50
MIPVRLQLKNFMSYGEGVAPLEFSGIRLACLSGDNGNGKTALLDAMTWALFDKTRAKERDAVIRLGANEAAVLFDFTVEGVKYRVRRSLSKKGGAVWELQAWQEDGTTRPLTGTNSRETGAQIQKLLKMDYETFLATGYLAQGRADEFTRATGSGRKRILADILGLERFERLEKMANERRKDSEAREKELEGEIRAIDEKLARKDYFEDQLARAQERLAAATVERDSARDAMDALLSQVERLEADEERARDFEHRCIEAEREIAEFKHEIAGLEERIREAGERVARKDEIESAYCKHEGLTEELARLDAEYDQVLTLEREDAVLARRVQDEAQALDNERYRLESEVLTLEREARELEGLETDIARVESEIAAFGEPERVRQEAEDDRARHDDELLALRTRHAELKATCDALGRRRDALAGSESAVCDYCGQALPPDQRRAALVETEAERDALTREMTDLSARGREAKRLVEECRRRAEAAQADAVAVERARTRLGQLLQHQNRIQERMKDLPGVRRRRDAHARRLEEKDYAQKEQERRLQIAGQLEKLERVGQRRADVRADLDRLRGVTAEMERLRQAQDVLRDEPPRVEVLRERVSKKEEAIGRATRTIGQIRERTAALPGLYQQQGDLNRRMKDAEETQASASRAIGELNRELEHCARLAEERVTREGERLRVATEREQFRELTAAFSDKGVQKLIIENALPELQNGANDLLTRMTNGAMRVELLLEREARTKGAQPIETLDILISDDLGSRPYEMFSGGEAFRINFALRVALSKLLARRAGAPLQTLILDEGFGTQDPRGREAITDAITSISDDFAVVLIITHIDELKEAFPNRIEVTKGPTGSSFTVQ